jgi:hypothetical protein
MLKFQKNKIGFFGALLTCAAFSTLAHAQETPQTNEIQNFGFENQMADWEVITQSGGAGLGVLDTQIKHSGDASPRLSKKAAAKCAGDTTGEKS